MGAQGTDNIAASRIGIVGKISAQSIAELPTPLSTHSDANILPSNNNKQVLKNNGSDVYENSTLELDDLDDVVTKDVIPNLGWVMKYDGNTGVWAMRSVYSSKALLINTTQDFANGVIMDPIISFQRTGTYSLSFSCNHSLDIANTDIMIEANLNGAVSLIQDSLILRLEPKDVAGNDLDGRGTNQKDFFSQRFFVDIQVIGDYQLTWRVRPEANGVEASVWEASVIVEEEFGIINV